ncbi:hypothetical protein BASA83_004600 [Batrachochytrium salamandrivorans]|nr:hypothetical protein BASA83_004600 [Batrachochytrium salamandrivorans]
MRLSTGIILSILSANAFAIEHPNGAHSGSLLTRRAVVADTDGPFLQKRNNDEDKEEPAKPKVSSDPNPDSSQKPFVYVKSAFEDDPNLDSSTGDGAEGSSTDFPIYDPNQDDEATGGREDVYTDVDSDQQRLSFVDAPGDSPSRILRRIRNGLSPVKLGLEWVVNENRLFIASDRVRFGLGGKKGDRIGIDTYRILEYALRSSKSFKRLYKNPIESPFSLELPFAISDESKEEYKRLQNDVLDNIKLYISDINTAIHRIFMKPKSVSFWLKEMMEKTNDFYKFISSTKPRYSSFLAGLGVSDDKNLERLDMHIQDVKAYKSALYKEFNDTKKMIEDHRTNSEQQSTSKLLSSIRRSRGRLGIKTKSSKDEALLGNAELEYQTSSDDE